MAEPGFVVCVTCNRAWHAECQKEYYVKVREDDKTYTFCTDDANCPAVYALDHLDGRDAAAKARALIAKRKRFRRF